MKIRDIYNALLGFLFYGFLKTMETYSESQSMQYAGAVIFVILAAVFILTNLESKTKGGNKQDGIPTKKETKKESSEEENTGGA